MRRRGGYAGSFAQRLGGLPSPVWKPGGRRVWIQAVSVGEVLAIAPVLEGLERDGVQVYLTVTTSTGISLAREKFGGRTAGIGFFPIDWWPFSRRAWVRVGADLAILVEGERWPEHIRQAAAHGARVININARLSERSFRRFRRCRPAARFAFSGIARILPCSNQDHRRLLELGVPPGILAKTVNIKLDVEIPRLDGAERSALRAELGLAEPLVLLGSSTWPGEEAALVRALRRARASGLRCCLLIVPRHAERRSEIEGELRASGLRYHFRTRGAAGGEVDVAVADTTGELRRLTQLADLVFVGKSLPPHEEGQTPVEAAALERPVLFGPGMANFQAIAGDLLARGAARTVADAEALGAQAVALLGDPEQRAALAAAAAAWHRENSGAAARTLAIIREELQTTPRSGN
jgi:3-deoxy-D-manno-octulosonic-acid transferase